MSPSLSDYEEEHSEGILEVNFQNEVSCRFLKMADFGQSRSIVDPGQRPWVTFASMRTVLLAVLMGALALASCEPGSAGKPTPAPAAMTTPAASDFCVAIRADYFRREQALALSGPAGRGALDDPWVRAELARYKLDYPKCFF